MKKVVFSLLMTLFCIAAGAQESQTQYNFLRLPASAHAAALGGDNITIIEDDPTLTFNNPALLGSVSDKTINLNFMTYMEGAITGSASFSHVVNEKASWAALAQYIDYGTMKETDANNIQNGDFSARDIALSGVFSYTLAKNLVGGITAKFITSYIGQYNSIAVGVDLGINYYNPDNEWSLSAVAKKSASLVDLNHWNYKFINHWVTGIDLLLSEQFYLAAGYNFRRANEMKIVANDEEKGSSHGAGISLGAGLLLDRFKLNVAYGKYHVSSSSLLINLSYSL